MNWSEAWQIVQGIVVFAVTVGGPVFGWLLWSLRHEFVKRTDCEACRKEMTEKLASIENIQGADAAHHDSLAQKLGTLPTAEDISNLRVSMAAMAGEMRAMQATMNGQAELLKVVKEQGDTVHKYLLNERK